MKTLKVLRLLLRLQKVLAKDHSIGLGTLKKEAGSCTKISEEILETMMKTHFPCSIVAFTKDQNTSVSQTEANETRRYIQEDVIQLC